VLTSYPVLTSVDIVADEPIVGCRTKPDPANPTQPMLVVGTCAASAALWEYASIKSLTLRAAPRMYDPWGQSRMGGRMVHAGTKSTGAVWHLDRNFTRVVARSKTLVSLDLRRSTFDQIPGWPVSLEVLCLQQCARMEVMPGASHTLRSLISLDLSLCPALYDISVLLGAASLQWLDLSGCSSLSEISPIAGCAELRTLNLNRCFSLREISALGTLTKLATLDLSSCPLVDDIGNLCVCETTQVGGSWCKALSRVDLSYTAVCDVACLAPIEALDGSLFQGCPELITLTIRGCKGIESPEENVIELLEMLPMLHVDLDSPSSSPRPSHHRRQPSPARRPRSRGLRQHQHQLRRQHHLQS
jgi:Leucine-rich repeat (LRR) protein